MRSTFVTGVLVASIVLLLFLPGARLLPRPAARRPQSAAEAIAPDLSWVAAAHPEEEWVQPAVRDLRCGDWLAALAVLDAAGDPPASQRPRRDFVLGMALLRAGRPADAIEPLGSSARAFGDEGAPLAAEAWFHLGEAHEAAGSAAGAARAYGRCVKAAGASALGRRASLRRGQSLAAAGDAARALDALSPLVSAAAVGAPSRGDADAERQVRVIACASALPLARARGDAAVARAAAKVLLVEAPLTPSALALAAAPGEYGTPEGRLAALGRDSVLARCERLLEGKRPADALADLAVLSPDDRVDLLAGRALRASGSDEEAVERLRRVGAHGAASKDPDAAALLSRATWEAALATRKLRKAGEARRLLKACADGPATPWRDEAALVLGAEDEAAGRMAAARDSWRRVANDGASEKARAKAAWKLGWSQFRTGLRAGALVTFDAIAAGAPEQRESAGARYWAARIVGDKGDAASRRARLESLAADFPRDYYGVVAAGELGRELEPGSDCERVDLEAALDEGLARVAASDAQTAARAAALLGVGLVDDALLALGDARVAPGDSADARDECRVLALALADRRLAALRAFRDAVPDWRSRPQVRPELLCAAYPVAFDDLVVTNCRERGLDPALVCGLIHQESVFEPDAVSWVGARGLMQVMPSTGRTIAKWLGESVTTPMLEQPATNVRYGTEYLRRMLDESGQVEVALASYNAGGGRAKRWWKASGHDVPLFVESIPFDETRDYVKAITWNWRMYQTGWQGVLAPEVGEPAPREEGSAVPGRSGATLRLDAAPLAASR